MRKNQVTIFVKRFDGKYPDNRQVTEIYADSNDLFEALSAAFVKTVETFTPRSGTV
ncbi:MAG: hypothetical protein J1F09_03380 [Oscillospiraceae bacterium]|nr:hypothetical protein [Oscillospiraceae bacterium]